MFLAHTFMPLLVVPVLMYRQQTPGLPLTMMKFVWSVKVQQIVADSLSDITERRRVSSERIVCDPNKIFGYKQWLEADNDPVFAPVDIPEVERVLKIFSQLQVLLQYCNINQLQIKVKVLQKKYKLLF